MRIAPPVNDHNLVTAKIATVPIRLERPAGAPTPRIVAATFEVSFDDGARWRRVPFSVQPDGAIAIVQHPAGAKFVSVRSSARDVLGNQVEQTIIRAYGVVPYPAHAIRNAAKAGEIAPGTIRRSSTAPARQTRS